MTPDSRAWTIAREDFEHARRSRLLWGALALISLLVVPSFWSVTGSYHAVDGRPSPPLQAVLDVPAYLSTYLFVIVAALAYGAVAGERESGTIRLLLGLPGTRCDVLVGKLLSRVGMLLVSVVPLLAILATTIVVRQGTVPFVPFAVVAAWVLLYGIAWTTFAVGASAAFDSRYRALAAVAGTYIAFAYNVPIWPAVVDPLLTSLLPAGMESYVPRLNPTLALFYTGEWLVSRVTPVTADIGTAPALVSVLVLLLVGVGGPLLGYRRFERADL
ncbi:ABC transporter permease [Halomicrococcus gelatinilyticus]|uniref:ABC transporter permease n=1 Tax=Halomicrococcus gelatinilyticus TaxID=1702103 RepID=UPI002E1016E6